jgi:integrase
MVKAGLVEARSTTTIPLLKAFIDDYIKSRSGIKQSTVTVSTVDGNCLIEFLGANCRLRQVTEADADRFADWMRDKGLAEATIGRRLVRARQFFRVAIRRRLIVSNPFADVKAPRQTNRSRIRFIDRETTAKIIDQCPDAQWRLIVSLCRFGGFRCPSEVLALKWGDVDQVGGRFRPTPAIRIPSPKTERNPEKAFRIIPIFPELFEPLQDVYDTAPEGSTHVITRYRVGNANLRTQFTRILGRASVAIYPKLFNNLRSSCDVELSDRFPSHVVEEWIGHSKKVADDHYRKPTDEHFAKATQNVAHAKPLQAVQPSADQPGDLAGCSVGADLSNSEQTWIGDQMPLLGAEPACVSATLLSKPP